MKTCRQCGNTYPIEAAFWSQVKRRGKVVLSSPCTTCRRAWQAQYRATEHGFITRKKAQINWRKGRTS